MERRIRTGLILVFMGILSAGPSMAGGGPFGIDGTVSKDTGGIFQREYRDGLYISMGALLLAGGLIEGGETRLGRTCWQAIDSAVISTVSTKAMKLIFSRKRPDETDDPDEFFKGRPHESFPSLQTSWATSIVTPFVLEFHSQYPLIYALELIPAYVMVARVKARRHWQSDVIAGFFLGTLSGIAAHGQKQPIILRILPGGLTVGLRKNF